MIPSPFKVFVVSQALKVGWQRTWPVCIAPLITDGPIILAVILVLHQVPAWYLGSLQVAGGLFMFYLAYRSFRSLRLAGDVKFETGQDTTRQSFAQALTINLLNPNPYLISGLVAGPIIVEAWRRSASFAGAYVLGMYGTFVIGLFVWAVVFGKLGELNERLAYWLRLIAGAAFVFLGLMQVWGGVNRLLGPDLGQL